MKMRFPLLLLPLALPFLGQAQSLQLPFSFEANRGQTRADVRFIARGHGYAVLLRDEDALIRLEDRQLRMSLANARRAKSIEALDALPQTTNYFVGNNRSAWRREIPNYARVRYKAVYPGIDLVFHSLEKQLEYDFVVAPHQSPAPIELAFDGADRIEILPGGELSLSWQERRLTHKAPYAYQDIDGRRIPVAASYERRGRNIGFRLGAYDRARPLVIDPVLVYSTYLGGNRADYINGVAVDKEGAVYVTGQTVSLDFPVKGTNLTNYQGAVSYGFISKFAPNGGSLVYSTIIGGNSNTTPSAITVDEDGNAYVTGITGARNFPLANAVQSTQPGLNIGFVLKLSAQGDQLLFSTYHGGERNERFNAIAIDKQRNIYVTGYTTSTTFPMAAAWQPQLGGASQDSFVAKYAAPNYRLAYSSYFGGTATEEALAIAVDASGAAFIAGATRSPNFATPGAYQTLYRGTEDAFVAKIRPAGGVEFFTYFGGTGDDIARAIALDKNGDIWIGGSTMAANLPVTPDALQARLAGRWDAYFAKLSGDGAQLLYSTYYGGAAGNNSTYSEAIQALAIDSAGALHLAGVTRAQDFPSVRPLQSFGGESDSFLVKFVPETREVDYSIVFGGASNEEANAIAVDALGGVYFAGETFSNNFPMKNAFRSTFGASSEGFLTKLCDPQLIADQASLLFTQILNGGAPAPQSLKVTACVAIPFTVEISGDFLKASPMTGNAGATLAVTVDARGLAIGDYDGKIMIQSADAKNSPLVVPVRLRVNPPPPQISASGIVNAASGKGGPVAPGELIVLYGANLGPAALTGFSVNGQGQFANELVSTRVYFDGVPAPLVYTSAGQVSAIVPYGVAGRPSTQVEVEYRNARSNPVTMSVAAASPALFTLNASGSGPSATLNQDYTVNGPANPAERGSTVILYATGEGLTDPAGADGQVVSNVLARPQQAVKVTIGGVEAIVDYAGSAPGSVAGVFQINARIPMNIGAGNQSVQVSVGGIGSPSGVTVSVK
jgi:uncharacterized protein (TIGR03437 family)